MLLQYGVSRGAQAPLGMFRAVARDANIPVLRQLLEYRGKWRLWGIDSYTYQLLLNHGGAYWRGTITVDEGEVRAAETIEELPGLDYLETSGPPPTIDGLFARIADAISQEAVSINVTWDPSLGFPRNCSIDYILEIAGEELQLAVEDISP